jgi:hypothetical protein
VAWGEQDARELQEAVDANKRARQERERLYRIRRFLEAYPLDGPLSFTYAQAEQLEAAGADYRLAEQLAAGGATPKQAMEILL